MTPDPLVRPGDRLYSTCAGEFYGEVVAVGHDENDTPTVDLLVYDPQDLIITHQEERGWPNPGLERLVLDGPVLVRFVMYRTLPRDWRHEHEQAGYTDTGLSIECATPGDGCGRCTKFFLLMRPETP